MSRVTTARIADHFRELSDPRCRKGVYPLVNIVVSAVCHRQRDRRLRGDCLPRPTSLSLFEIDQF